MYEEYLRALLAPLGVYRLDRDSLSGAELYALSLIHISEPTRPY